MNKTYKISVCNSCKKACEVVCDFIDIMDIEPECYGGYVDQELCWHSACCKDGFTEETEVIE